jgi:NAD(P)H-quinone oxidoreductase subunit 4
MLTDSFPWLTAIILFPLVAAMAIPVIPDKEGKTVRWYALGVAIADLALMVTAFWYNYNPDVSSLQMTETYSWVSQMNLNWAVAVDGLSMPLVLLTGLVTTLAIFSAWQVKNKPRLFYFLMLVLYSAQVGVFVAQDILMFFLMWEIELVPVYLLISIWGGKKRLYAATKFILYTAASSVFILVAGLAMAFAGDTVTFDMAELSLKHYPLAIEMVAYVGFLLAFGVKLAIFPLHTWLPDAHGEASAPVSMILAGVLLKMGGYALIRFNIDMLPDAHVYFAPILAVLGVVNIIYGAFAAFGQTNLKRRLAYSSISHMGFVLVGIASFTDLGISGAVLQMLSHGLIAACLFFLAGITYDRTYTLDMNEMGGLAKVMPKVFALFTVGAFASLALPGMSGFISELSVFLGITSSDVYSSSFKTVTVILAAVGLILTPVYMLAMLRQVFYGDRNPELNLDLPQVGKQISNKFLGDAKPREVFITACLLIPIVGIGFYPKLITQIYDAKTDAVATHARQTFSVVAQEHPNLYSAGFIAPQLPSAQSNSVFGMVD